MLAVAVYPSLFPRYLGFLRDTYKELIGDVRAQSPLEFALSLFVQNFKAAIAILALGMFLGLAPVAAIGFNFFNLGFFGGVFLRPDVFHSGINGLVIFFGSILPHGIFELPALVIASAFGLRLGVRWLLPASSGRRLQSLKLDFQAALKIVPLIFALLAVAAFIESFVTGEIIR